jgi:hypothetical protein
MMRKSLQKVSNLIYFKVAYQESRASTYEFCAKTARVYRILLRLMGQLP